MKAENSSLPALQDFIHHTMNVANRLLLSGKTIIRLNYGQFNFKHYIVADRWTDCININLDIIWPFWNLGTECGISAYIQSLSKVYSTGCVLSAFGVMIQCNWVQVVSVEEHQTTFSCFQTPRTRKLLLNKWLTKQFMTSWLQTDNSWLICRKIDFPLWLWSDQLLLCNQWQNKRYRVYRTLHPASCIWSCSADYPDVPVSLPCTSFSHGSASSQALQCNRDELKCCLSADVMLQLQHCSALCPLLLHIHSSANATVTPWIYWRALNVQFCSGGDLTSGKKRRVKVWQKQSCTATDWLLCIMVTDHSGKRA